MGQWWETARTMGHVRKTTMEQLLEMDIHGNIEHYIYSHLEGLGHIQKTKKNCGPRKLHQRENHLHFATVNCLNSIQESQGIGDDGPLGMWSILIRAWEGQSSAIQCPNWGIRVGMNDDSEVRISPSWGEKSWCLGVAVQLSAAIERCSAVPCHRSCAAGLSAPQKNRASLHGQSRKKGLKSRFVSRRSTDFCLEKYGRMVNWQIQRSTELLVWYVLYSLVNMLVCVCSVSLCWCICFLQAMFVLRRVGIYRFVATSGFATHDDWKRKRHVQRLLHPLAFTCSIVVCTLRFLTDPIRINSCCFKYSGVVNSSQYNTSNVEDWLKRKANKHMVKLDTQI